MTIYSQLDPRWKNKNLPNCTGSITIGNYGCLLTCIANIVQKSPDQIADENKDCWKSDGNMLTDKLLARLGYKLVKTPLVEGQPLPKKSNIYIARTSFFRPQYDTHFFLINPDGTITDPASMNNPKIANRYAARVNEMRELIPVTASPSPAKTLSVEERLTRIETKLGII